MHHYCIVASVGIMPSINRRLGSEDHVQRPLSKAAPLHLLPLSRSAPVPAAPVGAVHVRADMKTVRAAAIERCMG